jgi:4-hydroxyphenylpyruvate dioxygenase
MRAEPQVDIADPGGLVQRQVLRGEKDDFVVVLNSSANSRTLSSRFVNYYFGAGVQHIALSSRDIFKSVDEMTSNGMEMLTMPDNYYDDLTARFCLDSDLIERMRARQIIYDRDANGGEYFHCFTRAFERRFFFEIVQRCGYDGFDAPGAAIRIAAQSRLKLLPG